jgi:integrase
MPRHGENIRKRKDGRWEGRYKPKGKDYYRSIYGKSYYDVKEKIRNATHEEPKAKIKDKLFSDVCLEWLAHIQSEVRSPTYANYLFQVERRIIPHFRKTSIKKLDTPMVEAFAKEKALNGRLDKKGGLSAKSVHDLTVILSQIIKYANLNCSFIAKEPKAKTLDILSASEHERLVQGIMLRLNLETLGFLMALCTGIRIGELCALKWNDIYFDDRFIRINKTLQRIKNTENTGSKTIIIIGEPKSQRSIRDVPIPPRLFELLLQMRGKQNAFVLTGQADKFLEPRTYQAKFKRYLKEFSLRDVKFHILRHTFATRAIAQGFELKSLSEILGHATASFTLEKYVHSSIELKKSYMDKLAF